MTLFIWPMLLLAHDVPLPHGCKTSHLVKSGMSAYLQVQTSSGYVNKSICRYVTIALSTQCYASKLSLFLTRFLSTSGHSSRCQGSESLQWIGGSSSIFIDFSTLSITTVDSDWRGRSNHGPLCAPWAPFAGLLLQAPKNKHGWNMLKLRRTFWRAATGCHPARIGHSMSSLCLKSSKGRMMHHYSV